ncbi:uncharacterized protein LOC116417925 [Nasonia vitripennis]|uniref:Double jelly roll-like domain-containing protein n=1 Tax=Nasonia vitripennis TaxID=7425 RepID=A0A7M7QLY7_NASVI|nr:uncharacterized protein LOC116417925 [Nasonia vitripennis]
MEEVLSIQSPVVFDESVAHYEIHAHRPYTLSNFNKSDEIRIGIQHQDLCVLPSRSSLHICGKLQKPDGTAIEGTRFVNNAICHLFEEIRYELNAVEIDRCKNVGLTSLMKGFVSFSPSQSSVIENAGWLDIAETQRLDDNGYFDVSIPLGMILGFAEDYRKIVVNAKHELILTRSNSDVNSIVQTQVVAAGANVYEDYQVEITKIEWLMPYVLLSDKHKIKLLNHLKKDRPVTMSFRSWELYEYPLLPSTSKHVWTVKTANQLEKPRVVILGFQTNRKGRKTANASRFDHCNISNVTLFQNSQHYPYGNLNLNITNNQYALLYDMYANFQNAYYKKEVEPMLKKVDYLSYAPLVVIDCSKQNESLKQASVDVRLELEARANIPVGTSAYCLILHDRIVEYNPMSGDVKKIV